MFESIEANSYDVSINSPGISTFTLECFTNIQILLLLMKFNSFGCVYQQKQLHVNWSQYWFGHVVYDFDK